MKDYKAGRITAEVCIYHIEEVISGVIDQESTINRILSLHESQRKQTETLVKIRKATQHTLTVEQWYQLLNTLIRIIRNNIHSRKQLEAIQKAIAAEMLLLDSNTVN